MERTNDFDNLVRDVEHGDIYIVAKQGATFISGVKILPYEADIKSFKMNVDTQQVFLKTNKGQQITVQL